MRGKWVVRYRVWASRTLWGMDWQLLASPRRDAIAPIEKCERNPKGMRRNRMDGDEEGEESRVWEGDVEWKEFALR
jgi:hypothetical protein